MNPYLVAVVIAGGLFLTQKAVHGVSKAGHAVVHVFKHGKKAPAKPADKGQAKETKKAGS